MKKLFTLLLTLVMLITLSGCGTKMAIKTEEFIEKAENNGYLVTDLTAIYIEDEEIKEATIATSEGWEITFYILDTEENAIARYQNNQSSFENSKDSTNSEAKVDMKNYNTYTLNSNGSYKYLCRVDNTLLYVDVEETYKDEVKSFITELGY